METPASFVPLIGGCEITVTLLDGTTQKVLVRQVPVKEYPDYLSVTEDEVKLADFFCAKPSGWSETLRPESFEAVILKGEEINVDFFSRWVQRQLGRQERLMPGITQKLREKAVSKTT